LLLSVFLSPLRTFSFLTAVTLVSGSPVLLNADLVSTLYLTARSFKSVLVNPRFLNFFSNSVIVASHIESLLLVYTSFKSDIASCTKLSLTTVLPTLVVFVTSAGLNVLVSLLR